MRTTGLFRQKLGFNWQMIFVLYYEELNCKNREGVDISVRYFDNFCKKRAFMDGWFDDILISAVNCL